MKTKLLASLFVCTTYFASAQSFVQTVIGSASTYATSPNASMVWTIGEVMTETYSSSGIFFTQGFHQTETIYVTSATSKSPLEQKILIYPNPVIDNLIIDFSVSDNNYFVELYDLQGQLLKKKFVLPNERQLMLSCKDFAEGIYLLNIINSKLYFKTSYKIIKIQ